MSGARCWVVLIALCASGCGKPSTDQLIENLKAPEAATRIKAARDLPERKADAARIVPALIEALKDEHTDVRRCAAFGLGSFGEAAKEAIPALQASLRDREPSVQRAAAASLKQIDPAAAKKAGVP